MTTKINLANIDTAQDYSTLATALYAKANSTSNTANTAYTAALTILKVTSIVYPGNDTAADTAGGQTITLTGTGFVSGASVLIDGTAVSVVSVVNSTTLTFTSPVKTAGSYVIYVVNPDGGTAISIPGIQYSGTPAWTTAAGSIGSLYETTGFSNTVIATGDTVTYSLNSGTLPPGATFSSNGTITGTSSTLSSPTTYTFTVRATDAQNQDTDRSFSITINPDVITWSSPTNGTSYTLTPNTVMSNVTLSATSAAGASLYYYANTLPTGVSITGNTIFGTPTVSNETANSLITAVANTTSESANVFVTWTISVANDTYFKNTILLLSADKTPFTTDASANNFQATVAGDTKPNSFSPYTPGYYSNYFDGTGDYLSVPTAATVAFGTGDFTIEMWIYSTASGVYVPFDSRGGGTGIGFYTNGATINIAVTGVASWFTGIAIALNTWTHIAVTRASSTARLFVNGALSASSTQTTNFGNNTTFIGQDSYAASQYWFGYVSNVRIVKGTAVYTAAFTPPTTPLTAIANTSLLTCQSNRLIDTSNNTFAITKNGDTTVSSFDPFVPNSSYSTYGSGYFDGTGDYLTFAANTALVFTGDFTTEMWAYATATTNAVDQVFNYGGYTFMLYHAGTSWTVEVGNSASSNYFTLTGTASLNAWHHFAITRSGNTYTFWIDGVSASTATNSNAPALTGMTLSIGRSQGTATQWFTGYIADFRMVKGTAIYTTAFTPPTAPLTAVANTSLLTLQNNQPLNNSVFLDNSSNNLLVTRAGNTTQGTFSPYGSNWSNYFDGSGDYLSGPAGNYGDFGSDAFTIEMWIYPTVSSITSGTAQIIASHGWSGGGGFNYGWYAGFNTSNQLAFYANASIYAFTDLTVSLNAWNHIAFVGSGGVLSAYKNGIKSATTGTYTSIVARPTANIILGGWPDNNELVADRWFYTGHISNFRVIKGTALYTTTFTPSTTPLTAVANTSLLTCQSNSFIDNGPNNFAITRAGNVSVQEFNSFGSVYQTTQSYSGYFDGTGDYITAPVNAATQLGSNNFTIEFWLYVSTLPSVRNQVFYWNGNGSGYNALGIFITNNKIGINFSESGSSWRVEDTTGVGALTAGTWQHIAVVRNGANIQIYQNGVAQGSAYTTTSAGTSLMTTYTMNHIGSYGTSSHPLTGSVSNFRLVNGTALYTSTFTPSTTPLTAVSNTSLLTCQSSTFIDNSTNAFAITAVGDAKPRVFNPFGVTNTTGQAYTPALYGGSAYFDGTGDSLSLPSTTTALTFGTGDFTVEFWFYQTATMTTEYEIIETQTTNAFVIYKIGASGALSYRGYASGNDQTLISHSNLLLNTWYHIAVSRTSGVTKGFVNGAQVFSVTDTLTYAQPAVIPTIGSRNGGTNSFPGYISDFRIVRGAAVYTSAFVPPSVPLTAITNTTLLLDARGGAIIDNSLSSNIETVGDVKISTANSKFGGSSMYFDGSGDYLSIPSSPQYSFGTGDFTIEGWAYPTSGTNNGLFQISDTSGGFKTSAGNSLAIHILGTNSATLYANGSIYNCPNNTLPFNTWTHLAIVRSSGVTKLYINGSLVTTIGTSGSITDTTNYSGTHIVIGGYYSTSYLWNGYVDDFRITKGVARYTANFTPPTALIKQ